jgi:peptidoglycan/xylan/chitin deacetylase (PgdA/CDA1 family)
MFHTSLNKGNYNMEVLMKRLWILVILLLLCSGCGNTNRFQSQSKPTPPAKIKLQATNTASPLPNKGTPDLANGKEKNMRTPHALTLADLHQKYHTFFIFNGPADKRQVALSFDDAPDVNFTPKILDVLKKYGVKATFFIIGNRAEAHPDLVNRIIQEGHAVGNHSYTHPNLPKITVDEFHNQVLRTEQIIKGIAGYSPKLFRPPYGNVNADQIEWLVSQGFTITNWNVDSLDWKGLNADQVYSNVMGHAMPGSIVLQHGAGGTGEDLTGTVKALPRMIEKFQADGIKLVTIPQLLSVPAAK